MTRPRPTHCIIWSFVVEYGRASYYEQPAPVLTGIATSGNTSTVSFTTALSGNYSLIYTNQINASTNWPVVGSSLIGDGNNNSLSVSTPDAAGFFKVVRTP